MLTNEGLGARVGEEVRNEKPLVYRSNDSGESGKG
jgi:hypothetical protein